MISKSHILSRVGRMEQLASIRRYQLDDGKGRGMRAFEVTNASGFAFTVYPDRGLDIGPASFNGLPLTWTTRNGPVAPAFYDQQGVEWLRTWGGGLLTGCGHLNVGGPLADGSEGLHGRLSHTPAEEVNTRTYWSASGEDYVLEITGQLRESRVFGENLVTTRTIRTRLGWPGVELIDRTENCGPATQPFMQLYHMNFGWPLISESTRLEAAEHAIQPRDAEAAKGVRVWDHFASPTPNFPEQVLYHDLPADDSGYCTMRITNPDFGLAALRPISVELSYRKQELPYLVQWRLPATCDYVMGLEPANCYPEGPETMQQKGMLRHIEPGQVIEAHVMVEIGE